MHRNLDRTAALLLLVVAGCADSDQPRRTATVAFDTVAWRDEMASWRALRDAWVASAMGPFTEVALCRVDPARTPEALTGAAGTGCPIPTRPGADTLARVLVRGDTVTLEAPSRLFWVGERSVRVGQVLALRDRPEIAGALAWTGALRFGARWANGMITLSVFDTLAPARERFRGLAWWPPDPSLRIPAIFTPRDAGWERVPTVRGFELPREIAGTVEFELGGTTHRLTLYSKGRGARSMLAVIRDGTSGVESYPAGRFLDVPMADSLGRTIVDFNRARNPDCAFSESSPCPLPPRENWFRERLEAGERAYEPP